MIAEIKRSHDAEVLFLKADLEKARKAITMVKYFVSALILQ
jgi:hypothetical protein